MRNLLIVGLMGILMMGCQSGNNDLIITVTNPLEIERLSETIELDMASLEAIEMLHSNETYAVYNGDNYMEMLPGQEIDLNSDGQMDIFIFQDDFKAKEKKQYKIKALLKTNIQDFPKKVQAKFIPQRMDDFAWENDKVAFRMYGPALEATGEISSGVDVWTKKVPYFIIDKWYGTEYNYHEDLGEGGDYYKVARTTGCGGLAFLENDKLSYSNNFIDYKIIANGPIRTVFELSYAPWKVGDLIISEIKRISLDTGHYFNKFSSRFSTKNLPEEMDLVLGLPIYKHPNAEYYSDQNRSWISAWESLKHMDGFLGTAVLMPHKSLSSLGQTDMQYYGITQINPAQSFDYYAGFSWSEFGIADSKDTWNEFVETMMNKIENPLIVKFNK